MSKIILCYMKIYNYKALNNIILLNIYVKWIKNIYNLVLYLSIKKLEYYFKFICTTLIKL